MSLEARVVAALRAGGTLAGRWAGFEERHAQVEMARDVARALERGGALMAEAPTGVGKSIAYLLPAVLHAHERERRVVVATCTRSLQDQLFERDLPALLQALDLTLPIARLKGKQNYLCPRALDLAEAAGEEETETIEALRAWAATDPAGDLDRFDPPDAEAFRRMRPRVATDPTACTGATCRRGRECFWLRARRVASEARLTVVNHALLARAAEAEGLLPEYDVLIVDEAHRLEGVLSSQLERGVSRHRFDDLLRFTGSARAGRRKRGEAKVTGGLLARARAVALPLLSGDAARDRLVEDLERLGTRADDVRADADRLFARFTQEAGTRGPSGYAQRRRYRSQGELLGRDLDELAVALEHCSVFANALRRAAGAVISADAGRAGEELAGELDMVSARWDRLAADLNDLCDAHDPEWVYWRAQAPGGRAAELRGAPISVGKYARTALLSKARTAVLTSATLSSDGDFAWSAERLGLSQDGEPACVTATYPSPFPLKDQMRVHVFDGGSDEAAAVAEVVSALARASRRNMSGCGGRGRDLRACCRPTGCCSRRTSTDPRGCSWTASARPGARSCLGLRACGKVSTSRARRSNCSWSRSCRSPFPTIRSSRRARRGCANAGWMPFAPTRCPKRWSASGRAWAGSSGDRTTAACWWSATPGWPRPRTARHSWRRCP